MFKKKPTPKEKNQALQNFADCKDRGTAKYFVGRTEIIKNITGNLQQCIQNQGEVSDNWSDQTTLLQGAPGAGKSALLRHLETLLPKTIKSKQPVQICILDPEDLEKESSWQKKIAEALKPGSSIKMETTESTQIQGGVNAGPVQAGRNTTRQAQILTWDQLLTRYKKDPTSFHPVVLMIDEIQNIREPWQSTIAKKLEYFHKGTDQLPVFPVYGGLSYSHDKLKIIGLSRLSLDRVTTLPGLSNQECQSAVIQFLEDPEFGIQCNETDKEYWQHTIAEQSSGWPQHLTICLKALAGEIAKDPSRMTENTDPKKVLKKIHENKEKYYQDRLSHPKLKNRGKLAATGILLTNQHAYMDISELGEKLEKIAEHLGIKKTGFRLHENQSGEQFAETMVESGLLHKTSKDNLEVPVPSLVTYCENWIIENLYHVPALQTPELLSPPLPYPEFARFLLQKACEGPQEEKNNRLVTVLCQEYGFPIPEGREVPCLKEKDPLQYEKIKNALYLRIQNETTNITFKDRAKETADPFEFKL